MLLALRDCVVGSTGPSSKSRKRTKVRQGWEGVVYSYPSKLEKHSGIEKTSKRANREYKGREVQLGE